MMLAKNLKYLINQVPDNMPVSIEQSWDCNIEGILVHMEGGQDYAELKLTAGWSLTVDHIINGVIDAYRNAALKSLNDSELHRD